MAKIQTVTGKVDVASLGLTLPHEHLFTDMRGPLIQGYAQAEPEAVVDVLAPHLTDAAASGVTALVECSTQLRNYSIPMSIFSELSEKSPQSKRLRRLFLVQILGEHCFELFL